MTSHVKKMILVPAESVSRLHDSTPSDSQKKMSDLDSEMSHILQKQYAEDSEKWKLYNEALQRYLHFAEEKRKPVTLELSEKEEVETPRKDTFLRDQLEKIMPKTYKNQALRLYDYITREGSGVNIDPSGSIAISGKVIAHSNYLDLIADLTRVRKNQEKPSGSEELMKALSLSNFPLDLIGNDRRRSAIRELQHQSGEKTPRRQKTEKKQTGGGKVTKRKSKQTGGIKKHAWNTW